MKYRSQLQKHDPYLFQPPDGFSPWSDRLLIELRRRLKDRQQSADSLHQIAKLLDAHFDAYAEFAFSDPTGRLIYELASQTRQAKKKIRASRSPAGLRSALYDFDILCTRQGGGGPPIDTNPDWNEVKNFIRFATLALWKIAAALDESGDRQLQLMLEGFATGARAIAFDDADKDQEQSVLEIVNVRSDANATLIKSQKEETRANKRLAAIQGHERLWGKHKARALELANEKPFKSYPRAAQYIQPIIESEFQRAVELGTIQGWLKKLGWNPTKNAA